MICWRRPKREPVPAGSASGLHRLAGPLAVEMAQVEQALAALFDRGDALHRRLVFWYDANAEFHEAFTELSVPDGVEKIELADTPFAVKHRVARL